MSDRKIKVIVRARPASNSNSGYLSVGENQQSISIHQPKNGDGGYINNQKEDWNFRVNKVLNNVSQEQLFEEYAAPLVKSVMEGYNATIMTYGQTGSGKTFTITGATDNYKYRGVCPRGLSLIFQEIQKRPDLAYNIQISYLEIYNESMVDLLNSNGSKNGTQLTVVEDGANSSYVRGLKRITVQNEQDALRAFFEGEANRSLSEHMLNRNSSRSHCVFTVFVESRSRIESTERVLMSRLTLVDLAGSERLNKTSSVGTTLKEAMYINRSLTFLEQVIIALADKQREHIPFRQCKLTNVLRNSLGGNCQTLLIANIRSEIAHLEETISTLRFATRMMCVTNSPVQNVQYDSVALLKKYEADIMELKQELAMHDALFNRANVQYEPYSEAQIADLQKQIANFVEHDYETIEICSLRQIKETMNQFRVLYRQLKHKASSQAFPGSDNTVDETIFRNDSHGNYTSQSYENGANSVLETHSEDGVGETDDTGFGVGVAVSGVKLPAKEKHSNTDKRDSQKPNSTTAVSNKKAASAEFPIATATGAQAPVKAAKEAKKGGAAVAQTNEKAASTAQGAAAPGTVTAAGSGAANGSTSNLTAESHGATGDAAVLNPSDLNSGSGSDANAKYSSGEAPTRPSDNYSSRLDNMTPPSRSEEFEFFKKTKGSAISKQLTSAKQKLKERKTEAKRLAQEINEIKAKADSLSSGLESTRRAAQIDAAETGQTVVLDEEAFKSLNSMQQFKQQYAASYEKLRALQSEIAQNTSHIDALRQKLMDDFEAHYDSTFGSQMASNSEALAGVDEVLDFGEKFEKLQLERIHQEDPNSLAFYSARKAMEAKLIYNSRNGGSFTPSSRKVLANH